MIDGVSNRQLSRIRVSALRNQPDVMKFPGKLANMKVMERSELPMWWRSKIAQLTYLAALIAVAAAVFYLPSYSIEHIREETKALFTEHLKVLAGEAERMIHLSDARGLQRMLNSYVGSDVTGAEPQRSAKDYIKYVFIESGGSPYMHTFREPFPERLLDLHGQIGEEPTITVAELDGQDIYDMAVRIHGGDAYVHIGISHADIERFSWNSTALPFAALGVGLLFLGAVAVYGIHRSRRRLVEKKSEILKKEWDQWSMMVDLLPEGVLIVERFADTIVYANWAAAKLLGIKRYSLIGQNIGRFIQASDGGQVILTEVDDEMDSRRGYLLTEKGNVLPILKHTTTVYFKGKRHFLISFVDIAESKDLEARLRQAYSQQESLANYDKLTGLFNRRSIVSHAEAELNRAERGAPLSIALIDIDNFKSINDTYGHGVGDSVLKHVAELFRKACRAYDWIGRWGGEEFVILQPGMALIEAGAVANRIRGEIHGTPLMIDSKTELRITISLGVTCTDDSGSSSLVIDTLMEHADMALYRAKESGRNRACLYKKGELLILDN
jgi:diguanylate cyclase (GGDEF)-like protein/PAS domain S-box-containing protein